jgi:hypothetical protein
MLNDMLLFAFELGLSAKKQNEVVFSPTMLKKKSIFLALYFFF